MTANFPADTVFKIATVAAWSEASRAGHFIGSDADRRDGFIHLSTHRQVAETARKHFSGQHGLVLVALDAARLGAALKWEPSRGGDLFPHLYAPLPVSAALWVKSMAVGEDGVPELPEDLRGC